MYPTEGQLPLSAQGAIQEQQNVLPSNLPGQSSTTFSGGISGHSIQTQAPQKASEQIITGLGKELAEANATSSQRLSSDLKASLNPSSIVNATQVQGWLRGTTTHNKPLASTAIASSSHTDSPPLQMSVQPNRQRSSALAGQMPRPQVRSEASSSTAASSSEMRPRPGVSSSSQSIPVPTSKSIEKQLKTTISRLERKAAELEAKSQSYQMTITRYETTIQERSGKPNVLKSIEKTLLPEAQGKKTALDEKVTEIRQLITQLKKDKKNAAKTFEKAEKVIQKEKALFETPDAKPQGLDKTPIQERANILQNLKKADGFVVAFLSDYQGEARVSRQNDEAGNVFMQIFRGKKKDETNESRVTLKNGLSVSEQFAKDMVRVGSVKIGEQVFGAGVGDEIAASLAKMFPSQYESISNVLVQTTTANLTEFLRTKQREEGDVGMADNVRAGAQHWEVNKVGDQTVITLNLSFEFTKVDDNDEERGEFSYGTIGVKREIILEGDNLTLSQIVDSFSAFKPSLST